MPEGTKKILEAAFADAVNLNSISFPEGLEGIDKYAFAGTNIQFFNLPSTMKKVDKKAFEHENISEKKGDIYVTCYSSKIADTISQSSQVFPIYLGGELEDLAPKSKKSAIKGFLYGVEKGFEQIQPYYNSYVEYIKKNKDKYGEEAIKDEQLCQFMMKEKLLSKKSTQSLLENTAVQQKTELVAQILQYQKKEFGCVIEDNASFDDKSLERQVQQEIRKEQIKDQKGIEGITFVATGYMKNFGIYDEYTNAKDMSDLKEFIEVHGGFLRSAVSRKTDYLICNEPDSQTTKAKKARALGIMVITEDEFLQMVQED
jgi:hypothetical protein